MAQRLAGVEHLGEVARRRSAAGGPIKAMMLVAFLLLGLQIFSEVIKTGFGMMGRDDLSDAHE